MERKLDFSAQTNRLLYKRIAAIDYFKGKWEALEQQQNRNLRHLRMVATVQSIGSSTRIEGSTMSDAEVETLLKNIKITELKTRDEQEVGGYYDVLSLILDNFREIRLTESNILSLHNLLMKYSQKDEYHRGRYKKLTNQVVATYPDGMQKTVFRTTEIHLVQKEITELLEWEQSALEEEEYHPLLIIGAFIYEFLSIHPFQDGNGRLSRLLSTLLLLQNGYQFVQFVSFENLIESHKADYYRALMEGQKDRYADHERIDKWLFFFLDNLEELANRLEQKYEQILKRGGYLSSRRQEILDFLSAKGNVQIADVLAHFSKMSRSTMKADLSYLVREYYLEKTGIGRGTVYSVRGV